MLFTTNMLKKVLIVTFAVLISLSCVSACDKDIDVQPALMKMLTEYFFSPDNQTPSADIRDLYNFFKSMGQTADCSVIGSETGTPIQSIIQKAETITFTVPICADGTEYGRCTKSKPKYCEGGELKNKCSKCGCPGDDACNNVTNACHSSSVACNINSDCGINGYVGNNYCVYNNIYRNYTSFICLNPGKSNASCTNSITPSLISNCSYGCSAGSCNPVPMNNSCTDSDNGLNIYTKGFAYGYLNSLFYNNSDVCTDYNSLTEYNCSGTLSSYKLYSCIDNCTNGACNKNSCIDTDGGQTFSTLGSVYGNFSGAFYNYSDACFNSTQLTEYYCSGKSNRNILSNCPYGCSYGVCNNLPSLIIAFVPPTTASGTSVQNIYVNASINGSGELSSFIDIGRGLVGYWNFNNDLLDKSTYGNDLTNYGADCSMAGKFGKMCSFDGASSRANTSPSASLDIRNAFTIEAWIKTTAGGQGWVVSKFGLANNGGYGFSTIGGSNIRFTTNNGGWDDFDTTTASINNGQWHHVACVYTTSDKLIYIDGQLISGKVYSGTITSNSDGVAIGRNSNGGGYFLGSIDEVRIWNRALSQQEIKASYNSSLYRLERVFTNLNAGTYEFYAYVTNQTGEFAKTETRNAIVQSYYTTNTSYNVSVLVLKYFPTKDGIYLDRDETIIPPEPYLPSKTLDEMRSYTNTINSQLIQALENGSRYHGYKDPNALKSLNYKIHQTIEYLTPVPTSHTPPPTSDADHMKILTDINICNYVENLSVKEVWIWMYHTDKVYPVESYQRGPYGGVGNGYMELPLCGKTYTVYDYNYGRGFGEALEDHTHHLEAIYRYDIDHTLFWDDINSFSGGAGEFVPNNLNLSLNGSIPLTCGWTHCPPNVIISPDMCASPDFPLSCICHGYNWFSERTVLSDCEDWKPDGTGEKKLVNCHTWSDSPDCYSSDPFKDGNVGFKIWWMQNIPGRNNNLTYQGCMMRNWWDFVGNYDSAVAGGKSLKIC